MTTNTATLIHDSDMDRETSDLPDVDIKQKPLSYFEFWPTWLFYFPVKLMGLYLGLRYGGWTLPTIANPNFDMGGFVGESKSQILDSIPSPVHELFSPYVIGHVPEHKNEITITAAAALIEDCMKEKNLSYPLVIKPDIGCRGMGVQRIFEQTDIKDYINNFPAGQKVIVQEMADYSAEAGLFYIHHPDQDKGHIFSLTLKYFPSVIGDGKSTLKELIENDPRAGKIKHIYLPRHQDRWDYIVPNGQQFRIAFAGSHSRGTIFKNGAPFITAEMTEKWDNICKQIPNFYFGRFDVRLNKLEDLQNAENIKLIELNGAGAEATHIWDSETTLLEAYTTLYKQYKQLYQIGKANKKRGYKPVTVTELLDAANKDKEISAQYPLTH